MRRILLFTVITCLYLNPIFSQLNSHCKIDTTYKNSLIIIDQKYFIQNSNRNLGSFIDDLNNEKMLLIPKSSGKYMFIGYSLVRKKDSTRSNVKMLCITPRKILPINLYKPGTSVGDPLPFKKP